MLIETSAQAGDLQTRRRAVVRQELGGVAMTASRMDTLLARTRRPSC